MPRVVPLSTRLAAGELPEQGWRDLGELLGRFHAAGVFHADLTAHNLQVDAAGRFSLLDFDRGRIMPAPGSWMQANLDRLQRSLRKISADTTVRFSGREWGWLEAGYGPACLSGPERSGVGVFIWSRTVRLKRRCTQ